MLPSAGEDNLFCRFLVQIDVDMRQFVLTGFMSRVVSFRTIHFRHINIATNSIANAEQQKHYQNMYSVVTISLGLQ